MYGGILLCTHLSMVGNLFLCYGVVFFRTSMGNNAASTWYHDCLTGISFTTFRDLGGNLAFCFIWDRTYRYYAFNCSYVVITSMLNIGVKDVRGQFAACRGNTFRRVLRFASVPQVEWATRRLRNVNEGLHAKRSVNCDLTINGVAYRREGVFAAFTRDQRFRHCRVSAVRRIFARDAFTRRLARVNVDN